MEKAKLVKTAAAFDFTDFVEQLSFGQTYFAADLIKFIDKSSALGRTLFSLSEKAQAIRLSKELKHFLGKSYETAKGYVHLLKNHDKVSNSAVYELKHIV